MLSFQALGQSVEPGAPELTVVGEPLVGFLHCMRIQANDLETSSPFASDEFSRFKNVQVLRDSGKRESEGLRHVTDCLFPVRHIAENGAPGRIGKCVKDCV